MHMYGMPIECAAFRFFSPGSRLFTYALFIGEFPTQVLVARVAEGFTVKMKIAEVSSFTGTSLASESQPRRGWDMFFRT